jgi:predicted phosphoribosyltransferase
MYRVFADRRSAGRALVPEVQRCKLEDPIILGLPRGGIPLAYEIAVALHAPLDTIVVRKLGVPSHPELAFGAIASGGIRVINEDVIQSLPGLDEETIETIAGREMRVGQFYSDFRQTSDDEVRELLREAWELSDRPGAEGSSHE